MKTNALFLAALLAVGGVSCLQAEEIAGLPLHIQKINPQVVRVWVGDHGSSTAPLALATAKGIVVIDTVGIPKVDQELRKVIARELGRNDFKYLINTHEHGDHTGGNSVYADTTIVAHQLCLEALKKPADHRQESLDWMAKRLADLPAEIAKLPADSAEARKLKEDVIETRLNLEVLEAGRKPALPTRTFDDRMTLDLGDTTLELYYAGSTHTGSDIFIFIPQHGILMTGDTMADAWSNETPGCLASFMVRSEVAHNFPLLLDNWSRLLAKKDRIKDLIPGHWNGDISLKGFEDRYNYTKAMYEGVKQAVAEGKTLQDLFGEFALAKKFPHLVNSPGFNDRNQNNTIQALFAETSGLLSGAKELFDLIDRGAGDDALQAVLAAKGKKPARYFFVEAEVNARGYFFLQQDRVKEALRMFKANTLLFPQSWNVYDSLAEAHLKNGDREEAQKLYEKSLEINPGNTNAQHVLQEMQAGKK